MPEPVLYCSGPGFLILKKADLKLQGPGYSFLGDGYWCAKSGFLDFCGRVFLFWEPGFLFGKKPGAGASGPGFFFSLPGLFFFVEPAFYFLVVGGLRFPNYQKHRAPKCKVTGLWSPRSGFSVS